MKRKRTQYIHEGDFVARVEVEQIEADDGWSPYLSLNDAYKLDEVRQALRDGDIARASKVAQVFTLSPVDV
jgi:hypothetical protein